MPEPRIDEAQLVQRLRGRDEAAYEELVRTHADKTYGVALRLLRNADDAHDATQEAFLAAWRGIGGFDGRSAVSTWLHRIAVNASLAILRSKAKKRETTMTDSVDREDREPRPIPELWEDPPNDPVEQAEVAQMVRDAVDELGDDYRAVLMLRDVEEMPSKEVAAALGLSDASVRQRLHRARQAVAEKLRPELCAGRRMTCGGRLGLLFDWIDGTIDESFRRPVRDHLESCPTCRGFLGRYRMTVEAPRAAWRALGPVGAPEQLTAALRRVPGREENS